MAEQVTQAETLAVGDRVKFLSGPFTGEVAKVDTVRGGLGNQMVWVRRDTGELSGGWFPNRFARLAPAWVPKYAVRDRVRLTEQAHSYYGKLGTITEFVPDSPQGRGYGPTFRWVRVRLDGHDVDTCWLAKEFEVLTPEREKELTGNMVTSAPKNTAPMSFQTAAQELQRLIQAGLKGGVVRQRSWDTKGLYAGIDIGGTSLYTPEKVAEYIAAQTPIDVVGKPHAYHKGCYEFLTPAGTRFIMSPRGYNYWTPEDIHQAKGLATQDGKVYRLCRNQPVPFYTPEKS